jgi:hypothetical protein
MDNVAIISNQGTYDKLPEDDLKQAAVVVHRLCTILASAMK